MPTEQFSTSCPVRIHHRAGVAEQAHVFDENSILAVRAALAARRPLLVRGEPGVGKTQLAVATAQVLGRKLVQFVVDSRTESSDLLYEYDSVRRLAEAQLCAALQLPPDRAREAVDIRRFVTPGPLWWGFNEADAEKQAKLLRDGLKIEDAEENLEAVETPSGSVVLIDEIDKADTDVPNGLLEALGSGEFTPPGCATVQAQQPVPLVLVTSNEERLLPDAFVRRCLVLHLSLPTKESELIDHLIVRGRAHFQKTDDNDDTFKGPPIADEQLQLAAEMLAEDRAASIPPLPGLAEYLDLLRAARDLHGDGRGEIDDLLKSVRRFTLRKHQETDR
ncbi:MAG: AAA family ATPase [Planctomycetales bacterium]